MVAKRTPFPGIDMVFEETDCGETTMIIQARYKVMEGWSRPVGDLVGDPPPKPTASDANTQLTTNQPETQTAETAGIAAAVTTDDDDQVPLQVRDQLRLHGHIYIVSSVNEDAGTAEVVRYIGGEDEAPITLSLEQATHLSTLFSTS